jgi:hypothetical protein
MSIAGASFRVWRWPVLLFLIAFVVVIFVVGHTRSVEEPRDAVTQPAEAPNAHSETRVIALAADTVNVSSGVYVGVQKPGPPDPTAERTAADSAARAADAAAHLAGSAAPPTN